MYFHVFILCFLSVSYSSAQNSLVDSQLILNSPKEETYTYYDKSQGNSSKIMNTKKGFIKKYNPITLSLKALMFTYQNGISPQLISQCQYELTCSNFSKATIYEYGMLKGVFLTADRLMRDNLYSISGFPYFNISNNGKGIDNIYYFKIE